MVLTFNSHVFVPRKRNIASQSLFCLNCVAFYVCVPSIIILYELPEDGCTRLPKHAAAMETGK